MATSGYQLRFNGVIPLASERVLLDFEYDGSGGIVFGGEADIVGPTLNFQYEGDGGIAFGGAAAVAMGMAYAGAGGITFGGAAGLAVGIVYVGSGGIEFGGAAGLSGRSVSLPGATGLIIQKPDFSYLDDVPGPI